jgi:hypothetical protein
MTSTIGVIGQHKPVAGQPQLPVIELKHYQIKRQTELFGQDVLDFILDFGGVFEVFQIG